MDDITRKNKDLPEELISKIISEYKKHIHVPATKPVRQFLLCPVGLVGAGKTTVVKPLSGKLNLIRVSSDEIREILKLQGYNYKLARAIGYRIIKEFADKGYSIAIDANCGSDFSQEKLEPFKGKIKIIWIYINPPDEFVVNKLQNYKHTWLYKSGDEAVDSFKKYKERYGNFEHLNLDYAYTFDTSRANLPEQIAEAAEIIIKKVSK